MWCMLMHAMGHSEHGEHEVHASDPPVESGLDILKRRFALGEITRQQFDEMSSVLNGTGSLYPAESVPSGEHR